MADQRLQVPMELPEARLRSACYAPRLAAGLGRVESRQRLQVVAVVVAPLPSVETGQRQLLQVEVQTERLRRRHGTALLVRVVAQALAGLASTAAVEAAVAIRQRAVGTPGAAPCTAAAAVGLVLGLRLETGATAAK